MSIFISVGYELSNLGGYQLAVVETGGGGFTGSPVTRASGKHFLQRSAATATGDFAARVTGYTDILTAIETALNAGTGGGSYSVSFDTSTERVTIEHDGGGGVTAVSLTPTTNGGLIGQTAVKSGALSHEMQRTPDYWLKGAIGFWSELLDEEDDSGDAAFIRKAHNGLPYGTSKDGVAQKFGILVPLEPIAKVRTRYATASDPWTWQKLYRHARVVFPIAIDDGTYVYFVKLDEVGAFFKPRKRSSDYEGHYDMPLRGYLLAEDSS